MNNTVDIGHINYFLLVVIFLFVSSQKNICKFMTALRVIAHVGVFIIIFYVSYTGI